MRLYNNKLHTVISISLDCLRGARFWQAEADTARELNPQNYYGIDYAESKAQDLQAMAVACYKISKAMRTARPERVDTLYERAFEISWEADEVEKF